MGAPQEFSATFTRIEDCSDVLFDFPSRDSPDGPALGENICLMEANSSHWHMTSDKKEAQRLG